MTRMSSKMGAAMALWELFEMIVATTKDDKVILRKYSQMSLSISRSTYHRKLKQFEAHGLIQKRKFHYGHAFVITDKAKRLRKKPATKTPRKDGSSTLIIFDIPEIKHNARDTLRRFLVKNGYTPLKRSAFISSDELSDDIKDLIAELELENNITIIAAKIENWV